MRTKSVLALIPALVLMTGCDFEDLGGSERYHEDFHFNYPLKSGGRISVESFNGSLEISPWDQNTVDISGTKYAPSQSDLAAIHIDTDHTADGVSVRAVRPGVRMGNYGARFVIKVPRRAVWDRLITSNGTIRASEGTGPATLKTSNGGIHVDGFKGELTATSSNGRLEMTGIEGALDARTSNSSVHVRIEHAAGPVKLESSNGSIDLELGSIAGGVRARTSNSSITVRLPGGAGAQLSASTSNGSISSDFEMRTRGEMGKHHIEGTLGNGGPSIDLSTSNGNIRIVK
jgi:hypothetical protein